VLQKQSDFALLVFEGPNHLLVQAIGQTPKVQRSVCNQVDLTFQYGYSLLS